MTERPSFLSELKRRRVSGLRRSCRGRLARVAGGRHGPPRLRTALLNGAARGAAGGARLPGCARAVLVVRRQLCRPPPRGHRARRRHGPASRASGRGEATQNTFGHETVEGFALSPDGRWLAYDSDRGGNGDIWKVAADGGAAQQLTTSPEGEYVQDFSPDGREMAFHALRGGVRHIFVMRADGTGMEQVTSSARQEANPDFAPDGNTLAYDSWSTQAGMISHLYLVSRPHRGAASDAPRALGVQGSDPSWSPDGRAIACIRNGVLVLLDPLARSGRTLVPANHPVVAADVQFAHRAADGGTVYFKTFDQAGRSGIWSLPAAGGSPRLLLRLDDPSRPSLRREFATDGMRLYFTIASPQADIWVMDLTGSPGRTAG